MEASNTFNDSKYTRWYYLIIDQRAIKDKRRKGEVHHIIPRSLGGSDDVTNLVKLSGHDHAWCHWLLTKMVERDSVAYHKMSLAFNMMGVYGEHMDRPKSPAIVNAYERNRDEAMKALSVTLKNQYVNGRKTWNDGKKLEGAALEAQRERIKNRRAPSPEVQAAAIIKRVSSMKANGNAKRSDDTKALMSAWQKGILKGEQSVEHRRAISVGGKGKKKRDGHLTGSTSVGNISINRDGKEKRVKEHQLQEFLSDGWALGGRPRK